MAEPDQVKAGSYDLPVSPEAPVAGESVGEWDVTSLSMSLLARNVMWFCYLRWIVIVVLLGFGILGQIDVVIRYAGLRHVGIWPFVTGGVLVLCNVAYMFHARSLKLSGKLSGFVINFWTQIVLDLLVLTVVVHFLGSIRTYIPFTYLFHIVLSCVFFSRGQSLVVMIIASSMFAACITAENLNLVSPVNAFIDTQVTPVGEGDSRDLALNFPAVIGIWLVVWYLASHLSELIRQSQSDLAAANRRLLIAQEERTRHMLTTTHQLKAPFAAIHANAQLLLRGHCGQLPGPAVEIAKRILARSNRLAGEIQDMLQLANLSSDGQPPLQSVELDLSALLRWCIEQVRPMAEERKVVIEADISSVRITGVDDYLKMLFSNLLSNAVNYSYEGGTVVVRCGHDRSSQPVVTFSDEGIGIPAEKLQYIFDEHYRTVEALQHNKESSGLGLAIVRQVARHHGIRLHVESTPGVGTTFELRFPHPGENSDRADVKEN